MSCTQTACCPDDAALADTVTECAATDPTLAACCMREIQQQRYANQLRARLLEHDPTNIRRDMMLHTLAVPPAPRSASSWEDDDDDDVLANLRAMRLKELQDAAQPRGNTAEVVDVHPEEVQQHMRERHGAAVWHVHHDAGVVSAEVDEALAVLAARASLAVCRVPGSRRLCHELGLLHALPACAGLVVVEDGEVLAALPTEAFTRDGAFEDRVMARWLQRVLPAHQLGVVRWVLFFEALPTPLAGKR